MLRHSALEAPEPAGVLARKDRGWAVSYTIDNSQGAEMMFRWVGCIVLTVVASLVSSTNAAIAERGSDTTVTTVTAWTASKSTSDTAGKVTGSKVTYSTGIPAGVMQGLKAGPPRGEMTMEELAGVLTRWLREGNGSHLPIEPERVLAHVRSVAGEGPFNGSAAVLEQALSRHAMQLRQRSREHTECLVSVLVTLYLYDRSTQDDHALLEVQLADTAGKMQKRIQEIVTRHGLQNLYSADNARRLLQAAAEVRKGYLRDPLRPMFKYPLLEAEKKSIDADIEESMGQLNETLGQLAEKHGEDKNDKPRSWFGGRPKDEAGSAKDLRLHLLENLTIEYNKLIRFVMGARTPLNFGAASHNSVDTPYKVLCGATFPNDKQEAQNFLRQIFGQYVLGTELPREAKKAGFE